MFDSVRRLKRPNSWMAEIKQLSELLDLVYARTSGEIWLFDNDLKVLEDYEGLFELLYRDRVDGSLASRIRSVKILLRRPLYERFCDREESPQLFRNLCDLRATRLRTFFVGCLDEVQPPEELGGRHPWIFYLGNENLRSSNGIIIIRPEFYPFAHDDNEDDVGVAWSMFDSKVQSIQHRLRRDWFQEVFESNYRKYFKSIEPEVKNRRVIGYRLEKPREKHQVIGIHKRIRRKEPLPVVPPVDCAIITTLEEEYTAIKLRFGLLPDAEDPEYLTGWHIFEGNLLSTVCVRSVRSGSVVAARTTARVVDKWSPACVFLSGRCACWRQEAPADKISKREEEELQECDVLVANSIIAYEYEALKYGSDGELRLEPEVREVRVSPHLLSVAQELEAVWEYEGELPDDWGEKRQPIARDVSYACGCKLVRQGAKWFSEIAGRTGRRKIMAVEMEGEGVGEAVEIFNPRPEFLMVKGISDFADPEKSDRYNEWASAAAADFIHNLMKRSQVRKLIEARKTVT